MQIFLLKFRIFSQIFVHPFVEMLYFLTKNETKLKGYKHIQFVLWVKQLRMIPRYANHIKIPTKL